MTYQVFVLWSSFTFAIYISFVKFRFTFFTFLLLKTGTASETYIPH